MTNDLSLLLKKYSVSALFILLAIAMLILGLQSKQDATYIISTIMMFVAGVLSLLYSSGKISSKLLSALGLGAGVLAVLTIALSYRSVSDSVAHQNKYAKCVKESETNLRDIRSSQKAYAEINGKYAATWDELIDFIKNGKVPFVKAEGVVPSRKIDEKERAILYGDNRAIDVNMSEVEAVKLARGANPADDLKNFKRDTIMVSFLDSKFKNKSAIDSRVKAGFGAFNPDKLPIIPISQGKKWKLEVADSVLMGEDFFPAIRVSGLLPIARIKGTTADEISFGKLTTNDTSGSWEQ
jgi:hypothetical protein